MVTVHRLAYRPIELAQILGTSRPTIDRWIATGIIKSFVVGRQRFISSAEVERLITERESSGNAK